MDPVRTRLRRLANDVGGRAAAGVSEQFLRAVAGAARLHPLSDPGRHQVEVIRDLPDRDGGGRVHQLDIYRPTVRPGPWPIVMYVHGGGFRMLSKDSHWVMGLAFARFGYIVFNISYRLAPQHPYPAALADTCDAYAWVMAHAARYGGDLDRIVVAGESAGGNLVTALSVATAYRRPEPWARVAFETGRVPSVCVPFCAILEVSNPQRFGGRRRLPFLVGLALRDVSSCYLSSTLSGEPGGCELADPLVILERGEAPERPLPAFFVPVGTRDPLLDDTRRLKKAVDALGVPCAAMYYPGEVHAFHALVWRKEAQRCWRDCLAFTERYSRPGRPSFAGSSG